MIDQLPTSTQSDLLNLARQTFVALTTFRKSGKPVTTPMHLVETNGKVFFRTYNTAGKAKRLAHTARILLAPSDIRGNPTGDAMEATAHLVNGEVEMSAIIAFRKKYPVSQRLIPIYHKLRGWKTVHFEVLPESSDA